MSYDEAMRDYGCDKPDLRFGMKFIALTPALSREGEMHLTPAFSEGEGADLVRGKDFKVFDDAELVVGIKAEGCAAWSRKQTDALIEFVKRPQIGATGIIFVRWTVGRIEKHGGQVLHPKICSAGRNASACRKATCSALWPALRTRPAKH
jgi:aspartyl-tRNA synthetase